MAWWIWVVLGFLLLAAEFGAGSLHIAFFSVGAFVVAILVGLGVDLELWAQLLIFTGVSLVAFFFVRPPIMRRLKLNEKKIVDSMVGETATALEDIGVGGNGRAEMRGSTWSARNVGETALIRGQRCTVASVEGLVLHVRAS